jgi:prophage tail gpP-like protein
MSHECELKISGRSYSDFEEYSIDSNLLFASSEFRFVLSDDRVEVPWGSPCKLYINGSLELNGIIETTTCSDDKQTSSFAASGRDLMGLLVDSCCEISDCDVIEGETIIHAARKVCRQIARKAAALKLSNIVLQKKCENLSRPIGQMQIEPGMTIFDFLSRYASMCGLIFYCMPDGTMVFGKPKSRPDPVDPKFALVRRLNGLGNNIIKSTITRDSKQAYSNVGVVSQEYRGDVSNEISFAIANPDFPKGIYKPLIITQNGDDKSPSNFAKMTLDKMRRESISFEYTVDGHEQNGSNWRINTFASVKDEKRNVNGSYLIYGRTFTKSKTAGTQTVLRLGPGGLA